MGSEVCPKCGSGRNTSPSAMRNNSVCIHYDCMSKEWLDDGESKFDQHPLCYSNEHEQMKARIAALTEELERVKGELEDARIYITTEDGAKLHIRNLIRCGLRSLRKKRGAFWSHVADSYGVGSTSAHRLCRFVDLNPDTGELEPT